MQDAKQDAHGSPSGQGSQLSEPRGLLVLTAGRPLSQKDYEWLKEATKDLGQAIQSEVMVLDSGMQATHTPRGLEQLIHEMRSNTASNNRIAASVEALVQAMAEAEGVGPEDVPATVGLNGRSAV